jgi:hypothetical protein
LVEDLAPDVDSHGAVVLLRLRHPLLRAVAEPDARAGPLGFYMGAQGSLIVFVVICFWNAWAQDKIDDEFGVSDE